MERTHEFETMAERDRFIDENFPQRECSDVPGLYELPNGDSLGVFCNTVTEYPRETCGCENSTCRVCYSNGCKNTATVPCMYVGSICAACAEWMPDEYLIEVRRDG